MQLQLLTLTLEGITAGDYLAWARDPEPHALGRDLSSISVRANPLGDTVEASLSWNVAPPDATVAGPLAGLPLTPEVVAVRSRSRVTSSRRKRRGAPIHGTPHQRIGTARPLWHPAKGGYGGARPEV
jgi:hypothetical protein